MRPAQAPAHVDVSVIFLQLVVACIVGLILVASLLAAPARAASPGLQNLPAVGWLVVGLAASAWLITLAPKFVLLVADGVAAGRRRVLVNAAPGTPVEAHNLARWLVAFAEILVIQAMLRPPLVILVSSVMTQENAEAVVAAITVVALLLVLVWVHRSARPLVVTAARSTLDAFLASSDSDATVLATASPATTMHRRSILTGEAATRSTRGLDATVAARPEAPTLSEASSKTLFAPADHKVPDLDATRIDGPETLGGGR